MPSQLHYDSTRGQCVVMLLTALKGIGTMATKREAIRYISHEGYFNVLPEDMDPYPSAAYPEPRWHVLIAWARKDCVTHGALFAHDEHDCWQITRDGLYEYFECRKKFQSGDWDVRRCYVWTEALKKHFLPAYEPNCEDRQRPRTLTAMSSGSFLPIFRELFKMNFNVEPSRR